MKNRKRFLAVMLLPLLSPLLSSCGSTQTGFAYALETGTSGIGNYMVRAETTLTQGSIVANDLMEVYSACLWARVDPAEATANDVYTLAVPDVQLLDGTTGTLYFARHIRIGEYFFTGSVRNAAEDAAEWASGEYVQYCYDALLSYDQATRDAETLSDLNTYIGPTNKDPGTYDCGISYRKWYFDDVLGGNIAILSGGDAAPISSSSASSSEAGTVLEDSAMKPFFPEDLPNRYECSTSAALKNATENFSTWLVGKKLNFKYSILVNNKTYKCIKANPATKTWMYNPNYINGDYDDSEGDWISIDGVTSLEIGLQPLKVLFETVNYAFASVEYKSLK